MSLRLLGYSLFLIALTPFKIPMSAPVEQATENPAIIPRWEYKVLRFDAGQCSSEAALAGTLNSLGREGWELVAHEPGNPWAHYSLGCTLEAAGAMDEAAGAYRATISLVPDEQVVECDPVLP